MENCNCRFSVLYTFANPENRLMKKLNLIIIGIAFLASCNNSTQPEAVSTQPIPEHNMMKGSSGTASEKKAVVLESLDAGTYTYVRLEADGKEFWGAINAQTVEIGKSYYYTESVWMKDFESKQLQRTFDEVLFIGHFGEQPNQAGDAGMHHSAEDHKSVGDAEIEMITHSGEEISLEELFSNKEKYDGKEITVKGVVVKINIDIMDRNWIHIQDGTSFKDQFDLTVTITDDVGFDLSDIVAFKGTITLDKDFGAGYLYPVIMENASQVIKAE
jgi:hypothetical protein